MNLVSLFAVGFGAFAGAVLRWMLGLALNPLLPTLPLGTLVANLLGGFIMGIAMGAFTHFEAMPIAARLALTTGFLGGLTTFSTFSGEMTTLLLRGEMLWGAIGIVLHVAGSIVLTVAGILLVRALASAALA